MPRIISDAGLLRYTVSLGSINEPLLLLLISMSMSMLMLMLITLFFHFRFHSMANVLLDNTLTYLLLFKFLALYYE